jgi:hypothetical protein
LKMAGAVKKTGPGHLSFPLGQFILQRGGLMSPRLGCRGRVVAIPIGGPRSNPEARRRTFFAGIDLTCVGTRGHAVVPRGSRRRSPTVLTAIDAPTHRPWSPPARAAPAMAATIGHHQPA